jgi:hypothetical protein
MLRSGCSNSLSFLVLGGLTPHQGMKAVIQRCASASVTVSGRVISSIGRGLLVLVGIGQDDVQQDADYVRNKILSLRLFPGKEEGESSGVSWKRSVVEADYEVLCGLSSLLLLTLCELLRLQSGQYHSLRCLLRQGRELSQTFA